jgi:hypothetical protein
MQANPYDQGKGEVIPREHEAMKVKLSNSTPQFLCWQGHALDKEDQENSDGPSQLTMKQSFLGSEIRKQPSQANHP